MQRLFGAEGEALDWEALETRLKQQVLQVAARLLEKHLNGADEPAGPWTCLCGASARYVGRRRKRFQTVLGEIVLQRAYYHCRECGRGCCPQDGRLGLPEGALSPGVARMVAVAASTVSFAESSELLAELAGLRVDPKQVERTAAAMGEEVARYEREVDEPETEEPAAPTLYTGLDGTGLPMRAAEVQGRAGKQPGGGAKTREAKLCTVWSAESRDAQGRPVRDRGSVSYTAAIESAATLDVAEQVSDFAQRVQREARRRSFERAPRQVVLGDGASWIWNIAEELFPEAIQIVDRYHAKERLHELSKSLIPDADQARQWAESRCHELDTGRVSAICSAIAPYCRTHEAARETHGYFRNHRHRMRYPRFEAQGLCTSSGVLEAGCKNAIGARLKRSGMHWSRRGANAIMALRCTRLSGRFEDFWEWRAQQRINC